MFCVLRTFNGNDIYYIYSHLLMARCYAHKVANMCAINSFARNHLIILNNLVMYFNAYQLGICALH